MSDLERSLSDEEIEEIIESNEVIEEDGRVNDSEAQDAPDATQNQEVKIKKVRNPQPKLNAERLKGARGIQTIQGIFEKVKFKGRGYEEHDLKSLLRGYQYWCHRLYPKFMFEDCVERIERLGTKKLMQTHIKKIRLDMLFLDDEKEIVSEDEANEGIAEQQNDPFNALLPTESQQSASNELSEDQLERIRLNREQALRRLQQKCISQSIGEASTSSMAQDGNTYIERLPNEPELNKADVALDTQEASTSNALLTTEQESSKDFPNKEKMSEEENMDLN